MFGKWKASAVGVALLMVGCGSGTSNNGEQLVEEEGILLAGRVVKGIMSHATVELYRLNKNGTQGEKVASTETDGFGDYLLLLPEGIYSPVVLVVKPSGNSKMKCDVSVGCIDADGNSVSFGDWGSVSPTFELKAALPFVSDSDDAPANITVYSTLSANIVQNHASAGVDLTPRTVANANAKLTDLLRDADLLEIGDDVLSVRPIDVANDEEVGNAIEHEEFSKVSMGFASAAFGHLASKHFQGDLAMAMRGFQSTYEENGGELLLKSTGESISLESLLLAMLEEIGAVANRENAPLGLNAVSATVKMSIARVAPPPPPAPLPPPAADLPVPPPIVILPPVEETTKSHASEAYDELLDALGMGKEWVSSFRSYANTLVEAGGDILNGILDAGDGKINIDQAVEDTADIIEFGKTMYPQMGVIMVAALNMLEDDRDNLRYDLAEDPLNLIPDDAGISGVLIKEKVYYSTNIRLENGVIDSIGSVDFSFRPSSYYCYYYCSSYYGWVDFSLKGEQAVVRLRSSVYSYLSWSWTHRRRIPSSMDFNYGSLSMSVGDVANNAVSRIDGTLDLALNWRSKDLSKLPIVSSAGLRGSFYNPHQNVSWFNGRVSYSNTNYYSYQTHDVAKWAEDHLKYYSLSFQTDARVRVPSKDNPAILVYGNARLGFGISNSRYSGSSTWVDIQHGGEAIRIDRRSSGSNSKYDISNQIGAVVDIVVNEDARSLLSGGVTVDGKRVATIEASSVGPLIRYTDGTFESL